ncbi:PhzF family phenazine biosynthesis protein [Agromyces protaetiae]|uniref:PhzF family phenazine biosynthesis protein n=1 Tax=Agromyces protaetiae TaxID=2509455 RepID=A0A4P6FB20_9MICO|nr:PhzF family phenazine biosynthesis protein [Agromyces protaetiae]QAY73034.1 PhzF family phenazine biosynthesis protein [Agromyces protaetiae]
MDPEILRYAAFTNDPEGGNPAGIVLEAAALDAAAMQRIAAEVDYAETAFVTGETADGARSIRYFSPIAEVPFCGHATIATAVVLAEREGAGRLRFATPVGEVVIETEATPDGVEAAFTSVEPSVSELDDDVLARVLDLIGLPASALDPRYPPRLAFAGNPHPVVVVADAVDFDGLSFDPVAARALMDAEGWPATITVLRELGEGADGAGADGTVEFEARNIFPVGRIAEDPATGSAAAATGGYLRAIGAVAPPARIRIHQGRHVGRPGVLEVSIPPVGGITVGGRAVPIST